MTSGHCSLKRAWWWAGAVFIARSRLVVACLAGGVLALAQPAAPGRSPTGKTTGKTTDKPNLISGEVRGWNLPYRKDGELKAKLSGASARPLPGGELEIRDLQVQTFHDGEPQAVLVSPLCRYRKEDDSVISTNTFRVELAGGTGRLEGQGFHLRLGSKEVSSAGPFSASGPGGRPQLRGEGFRFLLEAGRLTVSNQVQALIPIRVPRRFLP